MKDLEQALADEWAVDRKDVYERGFGPPALIAAAQPIRPDKVLARLGINEGQLIRLVASGKLPRPAKLGHGQVAWRIDEVEALVPLRERR